MSVCAIVVPAFNEEAAIGKVVRSMKDVGPVVVVDDGSTDSTHDEAVAAGAIVVRLAVSRGYGGAIDAGFGEAVARGFRFVVTADGDGQHDPSEVASFAAALTGGEAEIVIGIRPRVFRAVERLCAWYAQRALGVRDPLCGLKGYDVRFYEAYGGFDKRRSVGTELMTFAIRNGARWQQRPITLRERTDDTSRYYRTVRANLQIMRALWALIRVR